MSQAVDPQHLNRLARTSRFATLVIGLGLAILLVWLTVAVVQWVRDRRSAQEWAQAAQEWALTAHNETTASEQEAKRARAAEGAACLVEQSKTARSCDEYFRNRTGGNPVSGDDIRMRVRATGERDDMGRRLFEFWLWLDVTPAEAAAIREVTYHVSAGPSIEADVGYPALSQTLHSTRASDGFEVAYTSPICDDNLRVDVTLQTGEVENPSINQCAQVSDHLSVWMD